MQSAFAVAAIMAGFSFIAGPAASAASPATHAKVSSAQKPVCDQSVMPSCASLSAAGLNAAKDPKLGLGTQPDGGVIFNTLSHFNRVSSKNPLTARTLFAEEAKLASTQATNKDLAARVKVIVDAATEVIKNGNTDFSPEQKMLLERIRTVKFVIADNRIGANTGNKTQGVDESQCLDPLGFPNAGYTDSIHTILVCPATMNATMKQFVHTMAHELGHVVSPCMERSTLYTVDNSKTFEPNLVDCDESFFHDENGEQIPASNDTVGTLVGSRPPFIVGRTSDLNKKLEGCGIMRSSATAGVVHPKLFSKTMSCLNKTYAAPYKDAEAKYVINQSEDGVTEAAAKKKFEGDEPPYCQRIAEEHFADSFEAKVVGIISANTWGPKDFQTALLSQAGFACSEKEGHKFSVENYPDANVRIETALNDPSIQRILNCRPPKADLCAVVVTPEDMKIETSNSNKPASKTAGPGPSVK